MSDKWWDMPDDELDDLFREASDKVEIPFDSLAFDKLRHKIDNKPKSETPKGFRIKWLLPALTLLLLVGVGFVYYFTSKDVRLKSNISTEITEKDNIKSVVSNPANTQKSTSDLTKQHNQTTEKSTLSTSEKVKSKNEEVFGKENTLLSLKTTIQSSTKKTANQTKLSMEKRTMVNSLISKKSRRDSNSKIESTTQNEISTVVESSEISEANIASVESNTNTPEIKTGNTSKLTKNQSFESKGNHLNSGLNKNWKTKKQENSYFDKAQSAKKNPFNQGVDFTLKNITIEKTITSEEVINRTNFFGVNDLANAGTKSLLTNLEVDLPPFIDSLPRTKPTPKLSRFGIRLALSPDINSIESLEYSALGGSVGLLFEYRISKKFALQTGVSYSSKKYVGDFEYYHAWPDWTKGHPSKPTEVDGKCKVIDIPINLRFNIFQKPRQTWFVSSGISSYIMLNETYIYSYAWSPTKTSDWSDKSSFYWSTLNLSIGWEKQLTKHLTFQAEPYLKTPLKGVGRGLVNLYSSGILFSTKYVF
ncbi:MAG: outer membrane beta-barrel protein [Bacteroidota bacterium]